MPSAFHTFKLVPMASNTNRIAPPPILPPSTPANNHQLPQSGSQTQRDGNITPSSDPRMNPPSVPRSLMTPAREMRESSVHSSAGSARKPRQNLDERDHILMLKHCYENKHNFKEGTKAQFWNSVNAAFQQDTGKVLAQMSATVGRLVETRRRQVSDWENGVIPQKPAGELNDKLDAWIEFLKEEDGEGEAERMRQVDVKRKVEEARREARRQAIAAEQLAASQNPGVRVVTAPGPDYQQGQAVAEMGSAASQDEQHQQHGGELVHANGEQTDMNGYRPHKRKRKDERSLARELQQQQNWHVPQQQEVQQQQQQQQQLQHEPQHQSQHQPQHLPQHQLPPPPHYPIQHPPEPPPKRVIVEGALSKEDWRDIMGNDARLRAVESKVDKIELLVTQNNKLLLQLLQNQNQIKDRDRDRERSNEEDRVPVHLDAEFERDYL